MLSNLVYTQDLEIFHVQSQLKNSCWATKIVILGSPVATCSKNSRCYAYPLISIVISTFRILSGLYCQPLLFIHFHFQNNICSRSWVYCLKIFWSPGQILTLLGDRASIKFYPCVLLLAIYPRPGLCYMWSSNAIKLLNYDI
jgi:hypothetical protein